MTIDPPAPAYVARYVFGSISPPGYTITPSPLTDPPAYFLSREITGSKATSELCVVEAGEQRQQQQNHQRARTIYRKLAEVLGQARRFLAKRRYVWRCSDSTEESDADESSCTMNRKYCEFLFHTTMLAVLFFLVWVYLVWFSYEEASGSGEQ